MRLAARPLSRGSRLGSTLQPSKVHWVRPEIVGALAFCCSTGTSTARNFQCGRAEHRKQ